jgi:PKD repeat protein
VTATLNGSATGGRAPYSYSWDLGDGTSSTAKSPSHLYSTAGTYTAAVTVNDTSGQVSHASAQVTVYPALGVSMSAAPASGVASLQVTFAASASGGLAPYAFTWTYGDGTSGSGAGTVHAFSAGTFHPTLTVHDAAGGNWTGAAGTITVSSPIVTVPAPPPTVPATPEASPSPSGTPSPAAGPPVPPPASPSVSPAAAQNPSGSQGETIGLLVMLLGSLFAAGLGGTLFLNWLRHRS